MLNLQYKQHGLSEETNEKIAYDNPRDERWTEFNDKAIPFDEKLFYTSIKELVRNETAKIMSDLMHSFDKQNELLDYSRQVYYVADKCLQGLSNKETFEKTLDEWKVEMKEAKQYSNQIKYAD